MTSNRKIIAVVPAAGIGSRMQADKPKQYLPIHGQPILQHTLNVLLSYPHISQIVLAVAAENYVSRRWRNPCGFGVKRIKSNTKCRHEYLGDGT